MSKPIFKQDIPAQSLLTITQTAVSCGIGLLLADKMRRSARRNTALAMISIGALSTLPVLYDVIARRIKGPNTERGMRRTLEGIRGESGFSEDAEVV